MPVQSIVNIIFTQRLVARISLIRSNIDNAFIDIDPILTVDVKLIGIRQVRVAAIDAWRIVSKVQVVRIDGISESGKIIDVTIHFVAVLNTRIFGYTIGYHARKLIFAAVVIKIDDAILNIRPVAAFVIYK